MTIIHGTAEPYGCYVFMSPAPTKDRTFRVLLDKIRDRYVAKDERGALLGIFVDLQNAIGSAVREANLASRHGCRVIVMVENSAGVLIQEYVAEANKHYPSA